jgi:uncharacterized protein
MPRGFRPGESGNLKGRPSIAKRAIDAVRTRMDGWVNYLTSLGTSFDKRNAGFFLPDIITDEEAKGLWLGDDMCKRIIEAAPKTELRRGFNIKIQDKDLGEKIQADFEELEVVSKFTEARMYENALAGAAIYPVTDDIASLEEPIDEGSLNAITAIHVLEPRELQPVLWDSDIRSKTFRQPLVWRFMPLTGGGGGVGGIIQYIHASRLIIFPGRRVTKQIQAYQRPGWGYSRLTGVYPIVRDFGATWGHVAGLLQEFAQGVLSMDGYAELMQTDEGEEIVKARMRMLDMMKSTLKTMVVDKGDTFSRQVGSLSGASEILHDFAQRIAAAAEMPVTVLFGMAPAGLNATGDNDVRGWYDNVVADREHHLKPRLQRFVQMYLRTKDAPTKGTEPAVWSIDFPPLWEPTEKERAETRYIVAQTDQIYYNIQAATDTDIAESRWKGDTYSAEMQIDWDAREKQKAAAEAMATELHDAQVEQLKNPKPVVDPNADPNAEKPAAADDTSADKPKPPAPAARGG